MTVLRSLWLALLLVALLPWGAHLSGRAAAFGPVAAPALHDAGAPEMQNRIAPAPHRCRTAVLCGHDLAVLPVVARPDAGLSGGLRPDARGAVARGIIPETLIPPPKRA